MTTAILTMAEDEDGLSELDLDDGLDDIDVGLDDEDDGENDPEDDDLYFDEDNE